MSAPQFLKGETLMRVKQRKRRLLLPNFEACSVALFATLALSGPLAARTPPVGPSVAPRTSPAKLPFPLKPWLAEPGPRRR